MVFSSTTFLFLFLPLVLLAYFSWPYLGRRNTVLLIASLLFYAWGEGVYLLIMLTSIGVNHSFALRMDRKGGKDRRFWLTLSLIFNLGVLGFFKYANFLLENFNSLAQAIHIPSVYLPPIHLPIGISFFTFQAIAYIMDVYRRRVSAQTDVFKLGLYISLFPQLIAGPIVRYTDIHPALDERESKLDDCLQGTRRFIIGLAKKVLIADSLGAVADQVFALPADSLEISTAWLGLLAYSFQIYFDFSGYSDMAIGLGRIFGFRFPENFNYPYIARSLREFWRRWHISLSTWFRDYLYIPLSGNRSSPTRTFFNLGLVFLLCGLWHGASWNFIVWGLFHGCFLILERTAWGKWLTASPRWLQHIYLILVVMIGWVFFRTEHITQAGHYLLVLVGQSAAPRYYAGLFVNPEVLLMLGLATLFSAPAYPTLQRILERKGITGQSVIMIVLLGLFLWSLATIMASSYQPFIYFRF